MPLRYGAALGQRNAALRALAAGASAEESLAPWTQQVAELGAELVQARTELLALLAPGFQGRAGELGLDEARLEYDGTAPTSAELEARLPRDLDRGATGLGPHLHDIGVLCGDRDLRSFGSQGEQRLAVLSLLLCEAELLVERGAELPLLLLDDALSELDGDRRRRLSERLGSAGQTVVTATGAEALPLAPGAAPGGRGRHREGGVMERLGDEVRGSLRSAGVPDAGLLADVTRAWPEAVGADDRRGRVAVTDRPRRDAARQRRVGGVGVRAHPAGRGDPRPRSPLRCPASRRRLACGSASARSRRRPSRRVQRRLSRRHRARARGDAGGGASWRRRVEDERLRELVRRAAAASLSARADDRHF